MSDPVLVALIAGLASIMSSALSRVLSKNDAKNNPRDEGRGFRANSTPRATSRALWVLTVGLGISCAVGLIVYWQSPRFVMGAVDSEGNATYGRGFSSKREGSDADPRVFRIVFAKRFALTPAVSITKIRENGSSNTDNNTITVTEVTSEGFKVSSVTGPDTIEMAGRMNKSGQTEVGQGTPFSFIAMGKR